MTCLTDPIRVAFQKWLILPDLDVIDIVTATLLSAQMPGAPIWLLLVGPSGTGKTEIIDACTKAGITYPVNDLTPASLVSGMEAQRGRRYGLLQRHQDKYDSETPAILLIKDFTSMMTIQHRVRPKVMSSLREIYDGHYTRPLGTGNSDWKGRAVVLAAVTGVFDHTRSQHSPYGERFLIWRMARPDGHVVAQKAIDNAPHLVWMREEMRSALSRVADFKVDWDKITVSDEVREYLASLAEFVARARTIVARQSASHQVIEEPEVEGTGRIGGQLAQLARGLAACHGYLEPGDSEVRMIETLVLGTVPPLRARVLSIMTGHPRGLSGPELKKRMSKSRVSEATLYRTLEDMEHLELIVMARNPSNKRQQIYRTEASIRTFLMRMKQNKKIGALHLESSA